MRFFLPSLLLFVSVAPLAAGDPGSTQNLVADLGNFDTGTEVASWQVVSEEFSDLVSDLEDAAGCSNSGSGEGTNTQGSVDYATAQFRLCVNNGVAQSVPYRIGSSIKFLDLGVPASVGMTANFYDGASCTGANVGSGGASTVTNAVSGWQRIDLEGISTGAAASIDLRVYLIKNDRTDPLATILIDRVVLATDDYVFADGFESGVVCRWSANQP